MTSPRGFPWGLLFCPCLHKLCADYCPSRSLAIHCSQQAANKQQTSANQAENCWLVADLFKTNSKEATIDPLNARPVTVVAEEMKPLRTLEKRYGVNRTTIYNWRKFHGHDTRFTGRPKSLPPSEWKQLDRFVVFLSQETWGFAWDKENYERRFLDSEEYDRAGNPLDYFQKIDRWVLANLGKTFDQYLSQLESEQKWPPTFGKSARN